MEETRSLVRSKPIADFNTIDFSVDGVIIDIDEYYIPKPIISNGCVRRILDTRRLNIESGLIYWRKLNYLAKEKFYGKNGYTEIAPKLYTSLGFCYEDKVKELGDMLDILKERYDPLLTCGSSECMYCCCFSLYENY